MAKKKKKRVLKSGSGNESKSADGLSHSEELASFEEGLHELESIVSDLEAGNLSLAESLDKYEKGIRNLKSCHQILEHAENRIRILTGVNRDGSAATTELDVQKTEFHQKNAPASVDEFAQDVEGNESLGPNDDDDVVDDSRTLF